MKGNHANIKPNHRSIKMIMMIVMGGVTKGGGDIREGVKFYHVSY